MATDEAKKLAVVFDFDTDSCYPAAAVSATGEINGGLRDAGSITGECRDPEQLQQANTYYRRASINRDGKEYAVHMYALYFEKDMAISCTHIGHRHDWEFVLIWTTDGQLTHASVSAHGKVSTTRRGQLHFDKPDTVKAVYHKDGAATHCFRFAKDGETEAENCVGQWITPAIVDWSLLNKTIRDRLNSHDFGEANCSFDDRHFFSEIAKSPPDSYPRGTDWGRLRDEN